MTDEEVNRSMFRESDDLIKLSNQRIHGIERLLSVMKQHVEAFDSEDVTFTSEYLAQVVAERDRVVAELHSREVMYDTTVVKMEQALTTRKRLLENMDSETGVLELNEALMDNMVSKQASLEASLEEMKTRILGKVA